MSSRVLVAYPTRYGSTAEIAEAIAARLCAAGLTVET
jgi:menaquinone-dependent protoporphyrinogen IX oxidase